MASPSRARLLTVARRAYGLLIVVVLVIVVIRTKDDLRRLVAEARPGLLLLCLLASFGQVALTSSVWSTGLRRLGAPVGWRTVVQATAAAAPSRYLPGSIWYAVSRAATLRRRGVPARHLAAVATLETVLVPVVGLALGSLLLVVTDPAELRLSRGLTLGLLAVGVLLLGLASPPVLGRLVALRAGDREVPVLDWPGLVAVLGRVAVFWLWSAGVFALYLAAFPGATRAAVPTVMAAYMLAWGVGWLAIFAPQGAGVFEVVLAALLVGGADDLAVLAAGYRAVILVRDLLGAAAAKLPQAERMAHISR